MAKRLPTKVSALLTTCGTLGDIWTALSDPESIGLDEATITAFKGAKSDASSAVSDQAAAKIAAKESTLTANSKISTLRRLGGEAIRRIDAFALAQPDPDAVYAISGIEPPQPRSASQPPGQPREITATIDGEGVVTLKWKCTNPPGGNVVYTISRSLNGATGTFTPVGVSGTRSFSDATIPGGSEAVCYMIRGLRGQTVGPVSSTFVLRFGQGGGGGFAIMSQGMVSGKAAA